MELLLSIDIGTTAAKMALVDQNARIRAAVSRDYPLILEGTKAEQDPELWWQAVISGVRQVLAAGPQPGAIILSGQMQDLILIAGGQPLRPAILYSDTRARTQQERLVADLGQDTLTTRSANLPSPAALPAKLLWLREQEGIEPNDCDGILLGGPDYVFWRLTGLLRTDYTTASTSPFSRYRQ